METIQSMDWANFKKSADLGFVRRHRNFRASDSSAYKLDEHSLAIGEWRGFSALTGCLASADGSRTPLCLVVVAVENGLFRVVCDDLEDPLHERHTVEGVIIDESRPVTLDAAELVKGEDYAELSLQGWSAKLRLVFDPFRVDLLSQKDESVLVSINAQSKLMVEAFEKRSGASSAEVGVEDNEGRWKETFRDFIDPKVRGPESIGMDVDFPQAEHAYGIPERTSKLSLPDTVSTAGEILSEPYRLYNLDVSYYELDKPLGLYGSIPLLIGRQGKSCTAVLWLNSSETYVDLTSGEGSYGKKSHWISESGLLDLYLLPGPTCEDVYRQYLGLTGTPAMPQRFALGYHQCRYSYMSDDDARAVNAGFEEHNIPYDVLWLDIDHTDGKRYFTWDKEQFPDPTALQKHIASFGRKIVTIIDPHIKRDSTYPLHQLATDNKLYITDPADGKAFAGDCWAGASSYFDYTTERIRAAWASFFNPSDYPHFTANLHVWNDMNEPSVFDGPEYTIPKHMLHAHNVEHRHVHNAYGHSMVRATYAGLRKARNDSARPFVLTRSFFAGTQRYSSVWTGDNTASWSHMASSVRMLLSLQMCGIALCGADVGGFFGNPAADLVTRWYQVGAFQPFFRGHSMRNTKRREPWLFGEPYTSHIRAAIRERYELLPYWYTLFAAVARGRLAGFDAQSVAPPMRPVWWEFGEEGEDETRWMVGDALLVAPVLDRDARMHYVPLPEETRWYDLHHERTPGVQVQGPRLASTCNLGRMFVLQRGGTIVARQCTPRGSSRAMRADAYTLVIALDEKREAKGRLYMDDGESYACEGGAYVLREFTYGGGVLRGATVGGKGGFDGCEAMVERIEVLGFGLMRPKSVEVDGRGLRYGTDDGGKLTVEEVRLGVGTGKWELVVCSCEVIAHSPAA